MLQALRVSPRGLALGVVLLSMVAVPVFVFGGAKNIYVDRDNKGSEDGSREHPYRTISKALKKTKGSTKVHVANGTYKENITIPKDVDVLGMSENPDKVTIEADNKNQPAVTMKHDTALSHVTVKNGRHAVRIEEDSKAHLFNVKIKNSGRDGIHIDAGPRSEKYRVLIDKVRISGSAKAGIFSEKRFVVIINSDIVNNRGDGLDFTADVKAWFEDNRFNDNGGSGLKLVLDGASIWSKDNSIRRNGREGVEVSSYGGEGSIGLKKVKIVDNSRYGIARIARTQAGAGRFGSLFLEKHELWGNRLGSLSSILRIH